MRLRYAALLFEMLLLKSYGIILSHGNFPIQAKARSSRLPKEDRCASCFVNFHVVWSAAHGCTRSF